MTKVAEVQRLARAAARKAINETYALQRFQIVRFGRHRDGYFHAQVAHDGEPVYVHQRWGSWLIPIPNDNPHSPIMRELKSPYKEALSDREAEFRYDERQRELKLERERKRKEERDRANEPDAAPSGAAEHSEAGPDAGLPA